MAVPTNTAAASARSTCQGLLRSTTQPMAAPNARPLHVLSTTAVGQPRIGSNHKQIASPATPLAVAATTTASTYCNSVCTPSVPPATPTSSNTSTAVARSWEAPVPIVNSQHKTKPHRQPPSMLHQSDAKVCGWLLCHLKLL
ncbi:hypothetical protein COEREDRAFT_83831 [Coemansia reversa NRRL 1564]|uniref:Uncharacterized protein n=1 Tax=Coemansia reversa (strain ATCC 12441 / NRRL 1564) TaxID=763665 RepID=A0A2G5B2H8_COERN|nr:hypothetical protein COEREDRAFT_83831 [Coemansia reversa NRRL 1564]|eukprot:PIA12917.1 hypothetical protein COEREDRAFT_83831 [Coemansia reversa NRRL 1564]